LAEAVRAAPSFILTERRSPWDEVTSTPRKSKKAENVEAGIAEAQAAVVANHTEDVQQIAEETAHTMPQQVVEKAKRLPSLVMGEARGIYYGSRELWEKLFEKAGMTHGKLIIEGMEFEDSPNGAVIAKLRLRPEEKKPE